MILPGASFFLPALVNLCILRHRSISANELRARQTNKAGNLIPRIASEYPRFARNVP